MDAHRAEQNLTDGELNNKLRAEINDIQEQMNKLKFDNAEQINKVKFDNDEQVKNHEMEMKLMRDDNEKVENRHQAQLKILMDKNEAQIVHHKAEMAEQKRLHDQEMEFEGYLDKLDRSNGGSRLFSKGTTESRYQSSSDHLESRICSLND